MCWETDHMPSPRQTVGLLTIGPQAPLQEVTTYRCVSKKRPLLLPYLTHAPWKLMRKWPEPCVFWIPVF
jgi:hypothetical protein